jgi:hypothetical protein
MKGGRAKGMRAGPIECVVLTIGQAPEGLFWGRRTHGVYPQRLQELEAAGPGAMLRCASVKAGPRALGGAA